MKIIDLSRVITHQMDVFPGEQRPSLIRDILPPEAGYVTWRLETNFHTGTHIDSPYHIENDNVTIDNYDVSNFTGKACLIDVRGEKQVKMRNEWKSLFGKCEIVLFHTGFGMKEINEEYYTEYPVFSDEIADALVGSGVRIIGFDSPSPDRAPYNFHSRFLKDGRFIVENLTSLEQLSENQFFTFMAMPIKVKAEASLIRAVALL